MIRRVYLLVMSTLSILLGTSCICTAQLKTNPRKKNKSDTVSVATNINTEPKIDPQKGTNLAMSNLADSIVELKERLLSGASAEKRKIFLDSDTAKVIVNVNWLGFDLGSVSTFSPGEPISIGVLTKGYKIGEKVEITIDSKDDESSLMADKPCSAITFIGYVNFENLALLKDVFSVEGEEEKIVILPKWENQYRCK